MNQIPLNTTQIAICSVDELIQKKSIGWSGIVNSELKQCFLVYHGGQIYSYYNQCPHTGVNLDWIENQFLDKDGQLIQCATHGALFEIASGECLSGPCPGEWLKPVENKLINKIIYLKFQINA